MKYLNRFTHFLVASKKWVNLPKYFSEFFPLYCVKCFTKQAGFFTRMAKKSRRQKIGKLCCSRSSKSYSDLLTLFLGTFVLSYTSKYSLTHIWFQKLRAPHCFPEDNPILWENTAQDKSSRGGIFESFLQFQKSKCQIKHDWQSHCVWRLDKKGQCIFEQRCIFIV